MTSRQQVERALDTLVENVPLGLRSAGLTANACITAGRIGVEALRSQGLRARPLAVRLNVMNAVYASKIEAGETPAKEWIEDGAKILSAVEHFEGDPAEHEHGWHGHLVIIAQDRYLLDLTANQFDRPAHDIHAEPFWVESRELAKGRAAAFKTDDGCVWLYDPWPENRGFLKAPAWSAYRVRVVGGTVVSERTGPALDVPVAPEVRVSIGQR